MVAPLRLGVALAASACVLSSCTVPTGPQQEPPTVVVKSTEFVTPPPAPAPAPSTTEHSAATPDAQSLLDATVQAASAGGTAGAAVSGPNGVVASGEQGATAAWSTIKVPIAIAALRADPAASGDVAAAITASDNAAAERLYATAGADAVDAVLSESGLTVPVNTAKTRPEFSTFGQTALTVNDEAQLADSLACIAGAEQVLQLMGQVDPGQSYGLGTLGALFKGGWGPDTAGMYQVRQFGLVPRGDGSYAPVAFTAFPADGAYDTGQQMLNAMAQRLGEGTEFLPAARCQP
ncbi:hypothetical protein [Corynebacterium sp. NML180780]|uniref:hypothetical protein n=1 Tax=Corynebacterium sp. NML180780 TaxID=2598459 RepID=UPI002102143D|nr:hypothetical protein [Corynebacterium sp. NML180780]